MLDTAQSMGLDVASRAPSSRRLQWVMEILVGSTNTTSRRAHPLVRAQAQAASATTSPVPAARALLRASATEPVRPASSKRRLQLDGWILRARTGFADHLALYGEVELALDRSGRWLRLKTRSAPTVPRRSPTPRAPSGA